MKKLIFKSLVAITFALGITSSASAIGIGGWVGYNFAAGVDNAYCESQIVSRAGECSKGGMALGGDLWLFGIPALPIKFGLGAAYIPVQYQKYDITTGSGGSSSFVSMEVKTRYIPVYAEARADILGFFGGVTFGYGISVSDVTVSGNTSSNSAVVSSASGAFGFGAFAGYGIGLGPVSIEGGARLFYISEVANIMPFIGAKFEL